MMSEQEQEPRGGGEILRTGLRWWILLGVCIAVGCPVLMLLMHSHGVLTIGWLAREPDLDLNLNPLDAARADALERFDIQIKKADFAAAERVLSRLDRTAQELGSTSSSGRQEADSVRNDVQVLLVELDAQALLQQGAWRLAHERLKPSNLISYRPSAIVNARMDAALSRARGHVEAQEPVVDGLDFVRIRAGTYGVGTPAEEAMRRAQDDDHSGVLADRPLGAWRVRDPYWICTTEVTREVYRRYGPTAPQVWREDRTAERKPASDLGIEAAARFCEELSERSEYWQFTLPTESEWEIACRAGQRPSVGPFVVGPKDQGKIEAARHKMGFGIQEDAIMRVLRRYVVFAENARSLARSRGPGEQPPLAVGTLRANPLGLFDMHGNVAEWCLADDSRFNRLRGAVLRGGSYGSSYEYIRAGARRRGDEQGAGVYGFRIVARRKVPRRAAPK